MGPAASRATSRPSAAPARRPAPARSRRLGRPRVDPEPLPDWAWTIGWIKPGPVSKTIDQFFGVTPSDVNVVISTTMWSLKLTNQREFDPASVREGQAEMVTMARDLVAWGEMDFLAVTGDLYQAALGPAWNASLRAAVEAATGVPTATAMTAALDAMHELDVHRVAIGTTVSDAKSAAVKAYVEDSGIVVPAISGHATSSGREIRALPLRTPYETAHRVFEAARSTGGADGIYLPSLSWRATEYAARLEAELGVPVITLYNSLIWRALSAMGHPGGVAGCGRILERRGG